MTHEDVDDYLIPALSTLFGERTWMAGKHLDRLLGLNEYTEYFDTRGEHFVPITDNYRSLLQGFAGPYGEVLLKAACIKAGRSLPANWKEIPFMFRSKR